MKNLFSCPIGTYHTVTWKVDGWAFVLTNEHFHRLVDELVDDDQWKSQYATEVTLRTGLINKGEYEVIQNQLSSRLTQKVKSDPSILIYSFNGDEAKDHISSFLNTYSHYSKCMCFYMKYLRDSSFYRHNNSDVILQIEERREQTIFNKMAGKQGQLINETNIPLDDVLEIEGAPLNFKLTLNSGDELYFNHDTVYLGG